MAKPIVGDELWAVVGPLLPPEPEKPRGGRPRISNRDCLRGIIFVLRASPPWSWPPPELGRGSGTTCRRRLKQWHEAGVWGKLHQVLLEHLADADQLDWSPASVDSLSVPAAGGRKNRPESDGSRQAGHEAPSGSRSPGIPLAVTPSAANVHGSRMTLAAVDAVEPIGRCRRGRPRQRPAKPHADKAYDSAPLRAESRRRGITPRIARGGI